MGLSLSKFLSFPYTRTNVNFCAYQGPSASGCRLDNWWCVQAGLRAVSSSWPRRQVRWEKKGHHSNRMGSYGNMNSGTTHRGAI